MTSEQHQFTAQGRTFPVILVALLIFGIARGLLPEGYRDDMAVFVIIATYYATGLI